MIKKINPIHITAFLGIILLILVLSVQIRRSGIKTSSDELTNFEQKAKRLETLKLDWQENEDISRLDSIAPSTEIKKQMSIKRQGNKAIVKISKINKNYVDIVIKNILNETFEIKKFNIIRLDQENLELNLEVKI